MIRNRRRLSPAAVRGGIVTFVLMLLTAAELYPIFSIVANSFKRLPDFFRSPIELPRRLYFGNYVVAFDKLHYFRSLLNTSIILVFSMLVLILAGSMAAFIIARRPGRWSHLVYLFFVFGIVLPTFTMLVPQIKLIGDLGLKNNYISLILLYGAMGMPMSLFLYTGFFGSIPRELEEAAKMDGSGLFQTYLRIFMPLAAATTTTLVMLQSIGIWNDFVLPDLIMTQPEYKTLMPALNGFYGRMLGQGTRWDYIYAAIVLCILPMIFIFFMANRYLIRGVVEGAIKG